MTIDAKSTEERLAEALRENALLKTLNTDFSAYFDLIPIPLAVCVDAEAQEVRVNKAFAEMLGIMPTVNASKRGTAGSDLPFRLFRNGEEVPKDDLPFFKCIQTNQQVEDELEVVRSDGQRFLVQAFAKPIVDREGRPTRAMGAFPDITAAKKTEQALEKALIAATVANEELQQFTYAASHDLQEPLRSIGTYAQLLQRQYAQAGEANEFASFIVEGVSRMNALIRDLLTYSRTGVSPRRTYVKLNAVLQWSLLNLGQSIQETGARITFDNLPELLVDETQMVQLFQNLISNAIKYRGSEPPRISVTAEEGTDACTISVEDNGIGIEPRFHTQVFGVFKRLHGREVPGTGIGLALCRKIVEGHGGKIWVESDGERGSVFRFTIPT